MIIGKINDDVYIDDAVLWKTKQKVVINNQEITDLETFNKVVDSIKEKDKEIERLKNGYCELKVKCNNGECDCTNEEYDGMVESNMKLSLEVERLNNIIEELEKEFEWQLKKQIDIDKFAEEQGFLNYNPVKLMVEHFKNKLKALKEGK